MQQDTYFTSSKPSLFACDKSSSMIACFKEENAGKTFGAFRVMYPLIETAACHFIIKIQKSNMYLIIFPLGISDFIHESIFEINIWSTMFLVN